MAPRMLVHMRYIPDFDVRWAPDPLRALRGGPPTDPEGDAPHDRVRGAGMETSEVVK